MCKVAIDKAGREWIYDRDETRNDGTHFNWIELPPGTIKKLIGRKLRKSELPVELKKNDN